MSTFHFGFFCGLGTAIAIVGLVFLIFMAGDYVARRHVSREGEKEC